MNVQVQSKSWHYISLPQDYYHKALSKNQTYLQWSASLACQSWDQVAMDAS